MLPVLVLFFFTPRHTTSHHRIETQVGKRLRDSTPPNKSMTKSKDADFSSSSTPALAPRAAFGGGGGGRGGDGVGGCTSGGESSKGRGGGGGGVGQGQAQGQAFYDDDDFDDDLFNSVNLDVRCVEGCPLWAVQFIPKSCQAAVFCDL